MAGAALHASGRTARRLAKKTRIVFSLVSLLGLAGTTLAVPPGEEVKFNNSPMGAATFDGRTHKKQGIKCDACHPVIFEEKTGAAETTFDDHHEETSCFTCHEVSFRNEGNCMTCHTL